MVSGNDTGRIIELDSLRGLAALSVVWSHYANAYGLPAPVAWWLNYTPLHLLRWLLERSHR